MTFNPTGHFDSGVTKNCPSFKGIQFHPPLFFLNAKLLQLASHYLLIFTIRKMFETCVRFENI
jgi:hypothetical protein